MSAVFPAVQGVPGANGQRGSLFWGSVATTSGLPTIDGTVVRQGDFAFVSANSGMYMATSTGWQYQYKAKGDNGEPGAASTVPGSPGTPATATVGTTTTLTAGSSATVTNSGSTSAAVFNFGIPRGPQGLPGNDSTVAGPKGDAATVSVGTVSAGSAGSSATVTNTGSTSAAILAFSIPRGADGSPGVAASVAVGTTSTGVAGSSASVSNSGTSSAAILNFTIPAGVQGPAGTPPVKTFTNPARALTTPFQVSTTLDAFVEYSVDVSTTLSLSGGTTGTMYLQYADNSAFTTNMKEVCRAVNGNNGSLTIGLNITQIGTARLSGIVPAAKWVRLLPENTTGTPTFTFRSAQEVTF